MAKINHNTVGNELTKTEWESVDAHGVSGAAHGDILQVNGTNAVSGFTCLNGTDQQVLGYDGSTLDFYGADTLTGYSGVSGYSGISGYSGYSGYSAYSGYSGISGYSGYSGIGTSGYSGAGEDALRECFTMSLASQAMAASTDYYFKVGEVALSATQGITAVRAGSIVGMSITYTVSVAAANLQLRAEVNGSPVWDAQLLSVEQGGPYNSTSTQASGTDEFAALADLALAIACTSGTPTVTNIIAVLEVQYDA